jgi:DNA-binding CsgD family transcriptional regulator
MRRMPMPRPSQGRPRCLISPSIVVCASCTRAAETELLASLARGQSIGEIAIERRRSGETLRSQLKAMFAKTATHTQSELVALALFANLLPMAVTQ